ncbi:MAG: DUF4861 family protein [Alistipes sp.]|nr:DUF4861 family protein [Alistipes sp.]
MEHTLKQRVLAFLFIVPLFATPQQRVTITVTNPSQVARKGEVVEVALADLHQRLHSRSNQFRVVAQGSVLPTQITYDGKLLFPVSVTAKGKIEVTVQEETNPTAFTPQAFGRFIPERKDDYAWENNRIGFRVYGPALKPIDGPSNGIDIWIKCTENLIVNKFYRLASDGLDYHTNRGEGMDCYKVGRTLGAGAMAPLYEGKLCLGENFSTHETLDNGPLRVTFRLTYNPLQVGNVSVIETRLYTLDANSSFCKAEVSFKGAYKKMPVAAGITLHDAKGVQATDAKAGWATYWEKINPKEGEMGVALLFASAPAKEIAVKENHLLIVGEVTPKRPLVYYFGAGWSQFGFPSQADWVKETQEKKEQIQKPLILSIR